MEISSFAQKRLVAIVNPETWTIHHPSGKCGHISFRTARPIQSWASADGSHARRKGKVCGSCKKDLNFYVPGLVAHDA